MRSVLDALYSGNIKFDSRFYEPGSPFSQAAKLKARNLEDLMARLDDSGKEVFEKYRDAQSDIEEITRYDTYADAVKFGILLMAEVFMTGGDVTGADYIEL